MATFRVFNVSSLATSEKNESAQRLTESMQIDYTRDDNSRLVTW
jgi:hypothetical protein